MLLALVPRVDSGDGVGGVAPHVFSQHQPPLIVPLQGGGFAEESIKVWSPTQFYTESVLACDNQGLQCSIKKCVFQSTHSRFASVILKVCWDLYALPGTSD